MIDGSSIMCKTNVSKMLIAFFDRVENIEKKGKNADDQYLTKPVFLKIVIIWNSEEEGPAIAENCTSISLSLLNK